MAPDGAISASRRRRLRAAVVRRRQWIALHWRCDALEFGCWLTEHAGEEAVEVGCIVVNGVAVYTDGSGGKGLRGEPATGGHRGRVSGLVIAAICSYCACEEDALQAGIAETLATPCTHARDASFVPTVCIKSSKPSCKVESGVRNVTLSGLPNYEDKQDADVVDGFFDLLGKQCRPGDGVQG